MFDSIQEFKKAEETLDGWEAVRENLNEFAGQSTLPEKIPKEVSDSCESEANKENLDSQKSSGQNSKEVRASGVDLNPPIERIRKLIPTSWRNDSNKGGNKDPPVILNQVCEKKEIYISERSQVIEISSLEKVSRAAIKSGKSSRMKKWNQISQLFSQDLFYGERAKNKYMAALEVTHLIATTQLAKDYIYSDFEIDFDEPKFVCDLKNLAFYEAIMGLRVSSGKCFNRMGIATDRAIRNMLDLRVQPLNQKPTILLLNLIKISKFNQTHPNNQILINLSENEWLSVILARKFVSHFRSLQIRANMGLFTYKTKIDKGKEILMVHYNPWKLKSDPNFTIPILFPQLKSISDKIFPALTYRKIQYVHCYQQEFYLHLTSIGNFTCLELKYYDAVQLKRIKAKQAEWKALFED